MRTWKWHNAWIAAEILRFVISCKLIPLPSRDECIFFIRHALRAGCTMEGIFNLTKIDHWFLVQIKEIVDFEEELATAKN
jgi:hypothetical protein